MRAWLKKIRDRRLARQIDNAAKVVNVDEGPIGIAAELFRQGVDPKTSDIPAALERARLDNVAHIDAMIPWAERLQRWGESRAIDRDLQTALERAAEQGDAEARAILNSGLMQAWDDLTKSFFKGAN